jgi:hypothetical protein
MPTSTQLQDFLNAIIQLMMVIIPIAITWFIRNYVKGTKSEKDIAAVVQLSNSAIDFVENLDSRGALNLPPDVKKGVYKLQVGSQWLVGELQRNNIKMSQDEAEKWLASEFQKRMGDVRPVKDIAEVTKTAIEIVLQMQRAGAIQLPPDADQITYLAGLAADWILTHLPGSWTNITRDEALTWARAELLQKAPLLPPVVTAASSMTTTAAPPPSVPAAPIDPLAPLAAQAVAFVEQLKASGKLALKPGAAQGSLDADLALAWLLTEAARQGLATTPEQLDRAVRTALSARGKS